MPKSKHRKNHNKKLVNRKTQLAAVHAALKSMMMTKDADPDMILESIKEDTPEIEPGLIIDAEVIEATHGNDVVG